MPTSTFRRVLVALALVGATGFALAQPIDEPPRPESLVEGHTVFATLDALQYGADTAAAPVRVSVGAPETDAEVARTTVERFPGILWFNDQYLVSPELSIETGGLGIGYTVEARYGAALAVLVRADDGRGVRSPCGGAILVVNAGDPDPRASAATPAEDLLAYTYLGSSLVTDPNDHTWVVDKYERDGLLVWAVNMNGAPAFTPDVLPGVRALGERVGDHCAPANELASDLVEPVGAQPLCGAGPSPSLQAPPFRDDPCMDYAEPSTGGYCYGGPFYDFATGCMEAPTRLYNALLVFDWEELRVAGAPRDHSDLFSTDTNGCSDPSEYYCPTGAPWSHGDEEMEGMSHSFHPVVPPHWEDGSVCGVEGSQNPTNHGGSALPYGACDYLHGTAQVDVYFSGAWRPPEPAERAFDVLDLDGSSAPFYDRHQAYPEWG